ncbi:Uncharacterised protein [Bordetella pertussis]|nr:Uncharacterised protein [Bordetella pertussis]CFW12965.1 Uncharacterised protein [Bordetella pertussis]
MSWATITVTGAASVFSRLPGDRAGARRCLASALRRKMNRPGCEFIAVGPHFISSYNSCSVASLIDCSV